jgi:lysophospholipase L1-like esterase
VAGTLITDAVALEPDLILIGVGGNDAIHITRLAHLRAQVRAALQSLKAAGVPVVVLLGPRFDTPALARPLRDAVEARCRAVNRAISSSAVEEGITTIDPRPHIGFAFTREPRKYYSEDLFHPGPEGYRLWADAMLETVLEAAEAISI